MLIGPGARSLASGQIETEHVGEIEVRGRADPIDAWRVVCAAAPAPPLPSAWWRWSSAADRAQPLLSPMVAPRIGREAELELLSNTFDRAVRDRRAHLVTVYGAPGGGKSRLGPEIVTVLQSATGTP